MAKKKPRKRGVEVEKMDRLYEELHHSGVPHKTLQEMTLREAAIQRHCTPEVVDSVFGIGFYEGIQLPVGRFALYRKLWDRTQEQKAKQDPRRIASIESLKAQIKVCQIIGLPDLEIVREVQKCLRLRGWIVA